MGRFFVTLLSLLSCFYGVTAYQVTVDAHAEECFFEDLEVGTKMGLTFEVASGGFLDIDVTIVGPDGKTRHHVEQEGNGKSTFAADISGIYTYCFSNKKSTMTPKVILFNNYIEPLHKPTDDEANGQPQSDEPNHGNLNGMIKELSTGLWGVKNEQEYMQLRDRNHREINESTNFRVVLWSIFEASVLFSMTLGQVFYLKRFFEVRRVV